MRLVNISVKNKVEHTSLKNKNKYIKRLWQMVVSIPRAIDIYDQRSMLWKLSGYDPDGRATVEFVSNFLFPVPYAVRTRNSI